MADWIDRFWIKVDIRGDDECWKWLASTNNWGYGLFSLGRKTMSAHRLSWMLANGEIPEGMCVLHRCDRPACINPGHLWLGTRAENQRDMTDKGRGRPGGAEGPRGEKNGNSKLTKKQVREIRRLYATGEYPQAALAEQFCVGQTRVSYIVNRKSWTWLN